MRMIIVGAGFAGLRLARELNNKPGFDIILFDRYNYHQFQPLFYQVATAGLDASNISFPLRKLFHNSKNVKIRLGELQEVKSSENKIFTSIGEFSYDILVLAMGAGTNFYGNRRLEEAVYPMKSTTEALQIRHSLIQNLEQALNVPDPAGRKKYLSIVVVGGGPTGVELSGAFAEMKHFVLPKDYPEIDFSAMTIYLLEGSPRTLAAMSEKSSAESRHYLEKLGVKVMTNTLVKDYDGETLVLQNGENIQSRFVIWAAGVQGHVPRGIAAEMVVRGNRIRTDRWGRIPAYSNIYVAGDLACMETPQYPQGHPQLASVAVQAGKWMARHFMALSRQKQSEQGFVYTDKGTMATIGRNLAVVDVPRLKLHVKGLLAWLIWMSLHLMILLGVKNRLFVFLNWLYNYITYDQSLRLLFREFYRPVKSDKI